MKFIVDVAGCWHRVQVVCGGCSRQCAPLAYRAYRRSRVCDNCDLILRHKTQPGFRCHDNASSAAGPLTSAAAARDVEDLCSATIDDELIARNNQPLCSNVSFRGFLYRCGKYNNPFCRNIIPLFYRINKSNFSFFYPHGAYHSAVFAMATCLFVCSSVCHTPV